MVRLKNNKHGFTMVELLAVITILGVLTYISIVSIQNVMKNAKEKYYKSQEESMNSAARNYTEKNRQHLPKINGQIVEIKLNDLVKAKYIDEVKNYDKQKCDYDASYVQIFYYNNEYYYNSYLKCPSYNSTKFNKNQDISIDFVFQGTAKDAKLKYTIKDNTNGLATYYYKIYADNKVVFTSENYILDGKKQESKSIGLTSYTPAKIKVVMTGISTKGESKSSSATYDYSDEDTSKLIKCGTITGSSTSWSQGTRKITVQCIEGSNGIRCAKDVFTKEFTGTVKTDKITIKDVNGNNVDCDVDVYIDNSKPTKPTVNYYKWNDNNTTPTSNTGLESYTPGQWSLKKVNVEASGSTDTGSKNIRYEYTITGVNGNKTDTSGAKLSFTKQGKSTVKYRACDQANNCSDYTDVKDIMVDYTPPTKPTITGGNAQWTEPDRTFWVSKESTAASGIAKYEYCDLWASYMQGTEYCGVFNEYRGFIVYPWMDFYEERGEVSNNLDVAFYQSYYQDIRNAFSSDARSMNQHWINNGISEGRIGRQAGWLRTAQNIHQEGYHKIYVRAISNAGLESQISNGIEIRVDKTEPWVPIIYIWTDDSNTKITNNTCNDMWDEHAYKLYDYDCDITITRPKGKKYVVYYGLGQMVDNVYSVTRWFKYKCNGSGGSGYREISEWTDIEENGMPPSPNTATECTIWLRTTDGVGHIGHTLTVHEHLRKS